MWWQWLSSKLLKKVRCEPCAHPREEQDQWEQKTGKQPCGKDMLGLLAQKWPECHSKVTVGEGVGHEDGLAGWGAGCATSKTTGEEMP